MSTTVHETQLDVRPVAGHIGAEIYGVDLRDELGDDVVEQIRTALARWKVVFFRDQLLDHAEQIAFARRFGKVTPAHPLEDDPPAGFPEILPIGTQVDAVRFGGKRRASYDNGWHTDVTALVNPPAASILRADIVPSYGGDTWFTNLVAAYEGLPAPLRSLADQLRAKHGFSPKVTGLGSYGANVAKSPLIAIHPIVRVHPETGERALFVSPSFTKGYSEIEGFDDAAHSRNVLELFYEHIARPEYTVRFRWEPGSIAFWDNRATAHLAPRDLDHLEFERVLFRVTLEGDVPVGVDGRASELVSGEPFLATT